MSRFISLTATIACLMVILPPDRCYAAIGCPALLMGDMQQPAPGLFGYGPKGKAETRDERCEGKVFQDHAAAERFVVESYAFQAQIPTSSIPDLLEVSGFGLGANERGQITLFSPGQGYRLDLFVTGATSSRWPYSQIARSLGIQPALLKIVGRIGGAGTLVFFPVSIRPRGAPAVSSSPRGGPQLSVSYPEYLAAVDVFIGGWTKPGECGKFQHAPVFSGTAIGAGQPFTINIPRDAQARFCLRFLLEKRKEGTTIAQEANLFFVK